MVIDGENYKVHADYCHYTLSGTGYTSQNCLDFLYCKRSDVFYSYILAFIVQNILRYLFPYEENCI